MRIQHLRCVIRWLFLCMVLFVWFLEYVVVYLVIGTVVSTITKMDQSSFEPRAASWIDHLFRHPRPHGGFH